MQTPLPAMRILLEPMDGSDSSIVCALIGVERVQIHLSAEKWIKPGTKAVLKFDRIAVPGEIGYCNRKDQEYITCFVTENSRVAPRFPIDEPGSLTLLGAAENCSFDCRLTDFSRTGLSLNTTAAVKVGSTICVQTGFLLVIGEVRHQSRNPAHDSENTFHVGVEITHVLSDETAQRPGKGFRQKVAELILGRQIGAL